MFFLLWLLPLIVCVWFAICIVAAWVGGWARLAQSYRAAYRPEGRKFRMQSVGFDWANYGNCVTILVSRDGLYLAVWPLFRFSHPPLLLPWSALQVLAVHDRWWRRDVTVAVGTPPLVRLRLPLHVVDAAKDLLPASDSADVSAPGPGSQQ
jgi:hypothetical protein